MVDIVKESNKILEELGYPEIDVRHKKKRLKYMESVIHTTHKTKYPVLELRGNEPSLIRLGLAYLIAHEISHVEYREDNPISDDEDYTDEFKEIERHNIERIWGIFLESDKELENYS